MDLHRIAAGIVPCVAAIVGLGVLATAGVTWAAGQGLPEVGSVPAVTTPAPVAPLVVPDVRQEAFVFAKGTLEDAGFSWKVSGSVHGFAANIVVGESPAPGTRVVDTGAPPVTLTLERNAPYGQPGEAEDESPYAATPLESADLASALGPARTATTATTAKTATPAKSAKTATTATTATTAKTATPAKSAKTATTATTAKTATPAKSAKSAKTAKSATSTKTAAPAKQAKTSAAWPKTRPPAFVVPGAKKEPLNEMPLPDRAQALARWLDAHPQRTTANVDYWLYQNAWIVTGAKFGWWHGGQALQTLIAVDRHAQSLWQIGSKSAAVAAQALSYVNAKTKP